MNWAERRRVARRYTFAHGHGHLSTFLSSLSMLGLVLAIALLIVVLSVMNGFDREMRERILSLVPHISVYSHEPMADWRTRRDEVQQHPQVVQASPFTQFDALFMRGTDIETAQGIGVEVAGPGSDTLLALLSTAERTTFVRRADALVLGVGIARRLNARVGETLTLIVPGGGLTGDTGPTRFESLYLAGIVETGTELDQGVALLHLDTASRLAGLDDAVSGLRLASNDLFQVRRIAWEVVNQLPVGHYATNWMMTHGNLYAAIQLSRDLVSILLFSIIAVAAFNVVSSLVLVVFDKQDNIAILRTLGASGADIAWIFVLQGAMIGTVGVICGSLLGALLSQLVPGMVAGLEQLLGVRFLNTDVYPVSFLPVDLLLRDVLTVSGVALAMCLVAAIYPARRAARLAPAAVLNQER
ncbi:lipoprotein-releasing ABC transporter permease subunit [Seongchinamella unica]|uniref:Lipoprotein-releasing ABC transporter permease subunit n=1 Tax=Seongchinamella unica TaxID=2547392 RepID=A0A4R5LSY4_9GAMM|nr:lipoprotein-releasing ABC transporter permease subunit [Seongchinamella unica]TDG14000.1 lipoprotein-releasing ABC transporter permease subunit [Seongchinamella unica]